MVLAENQNLLCCVVSCCYCCWWWWINKLRAVAPDDELLPFTRILFNSSWFWMREVRSLWGLARDLSRHGAHSFMLVSEISVKPWLRSQVTAVAQDAIRAVPDDVFKESQGCCVCLLSLLEVRDILELLVGTQETKHQRHKSMNADGYAESATTSRRNFTTCLAEQTRNMVWRAGCALSILHL